MLIEKKETQWMTSSLNVLHNIVDLVKEMEGNLDKAVTDEVDQLKKRGGNRATQEIATIEKTYSRLIFKPLRFNYNKVKDRFMGIISESEDGSDAISWLIDHVEQNLIEVGDRIEEARGTNAECDWVLKRAYQHLAEQCSDIPGQLKFSTDKRSQVLQELITTTRPNELTEKLCHDFEGKPKFTQVYAGELAAKETLEYLREHGGLSEVGESKTDDKICEVADNLCALAGEIAQKEAQDYYVDNESRTALIAHCGKLPAMLYPKVYSKAVRQFAELITTPEYEDCQ